MTKEVFHRRFPYVQRVFCMFLMTGPTDLDCLTSSVCREFQGLSNSIVLKNICEETKKLSKNDLPDFRRKRLNFNKIQISQERKKFLKKAIHTFFSRFKANRMAYETWLHVLIKELR